MYVRTYPEFTGKAQAGSGIGLGTRLVVPTQLQRHGSTFGFRSSKCRAIGLLARGTDAVRLARASVLQGPHVEECGVYDVEEQLRIRLVVIGVLLVVTATSAAQAQGG